MQFREKVVDERIFSLYVSVVVTIKSAPRGGSNDNGNHRH